MAAVNDVGTGNVVSIMLQTPSSSELRISIIINSLLLFHTVSVIEVISEVISVISNSNDSNSISNWSYSFNFKVHYEVA